jgi:prophage pi3 protein
MNLWQETLDVLKDHDLSWDDVVCVAGDEFQVSKDNFEVVAKRTNYDSGYGWQEVAYDIRLYGDGFILFRGEYDGSEWWEYIDTRVPTSLHTEGIDLLALRGENLKEMQDEVAD